MKNAVIIHGMPGEEEYFSDNHPSPSNHHWIPWLQKQFLKSGYLAQTPEMPRAWDPDYSSWRAVFEQHPIGPESILVGHSCGGGFIVRWLSENKVEVKRAVLVAPWLDPQGRECPDFFKFAIDLNLHRRTELHVIFSDNDSDDVEASVSLIKSSIPEANYHLFPGYGHFCLGNLGSNAFPELAAIALPASASP